MTRQPFACELSTDRIARINGLDLHFLEAGSREAPPVCFLHGGAAHAHWFDRVIPALVDRFHTVSLDQRGHGASAWATPPAYATEDFASDLVALMDHFGWERMALVGHSMGGHNAMGFAAWEGWATRRAAVQIGGEYRIYEGAAGFSLTAGNGAGRINTREREQKRSRQRPKCSPA